MYGVKKIRTRVERSKAVGLCLSRRTQFALRVGDGVGKLSRRVIGGGGSVIGGRVAMLIDTQALNKATRGKPIALITGTNGKTTTTAFLASILKSSGTSRVAVNATGSNMPAGILTAVATNLNFDQGVFEVDERYLPELIAKTTASVVVLLNLSRDQLDRSSEVRMLSERWHRALDSESVGVSGQKGKAAHDSAMTVIANSDDPLVVWGAIKARDVIWVSAGLAWRLDAVGCPACEGTITFNQDRLELQDFPLGLKGEIEQGLDDENHRYDWSCSCGFRRPTPSAWIDKDSSGSYWLMETDKTRSQIKLEIPGEFNVGNALMALTAAKSLGVSGSDAINAVESIREVVGRFSIKTVSGVRTRLLLAKNPSGWSEMVKLQLNSHRPLVIAINSRIADGRDPSWLWDVPFEMLSNRTIVASGDRCRDLSVRLHYANLEHQVVRDSMDAIRAAFATRPECAASSEVNPIRDSRNPTRDSRSTTIEGNISSTEANNYFAHSSPAIHSSPLLDNSMIDPLDSSGLHQSTNQHQSTNCDQWDVEFIGNYTAFNDLLKYT